MARLDKIRRRAFLTPGEAAAIAHDHAAEETNKLRLALAAEREALRDSIRSLATTRTKTTRNLFEIKLTINRAALETCVGEQAAVMIATHSQKMTVERTERTG